MSAQDGVRLPAGVHLAYAVPGEAWYAGAAPGPPEYQVSARPDEGGPVLWSFTITQTGGKARLGMRLTMHDGAFGAFTQVPGFFAALASAGNIGAVRRLLDGLGAVDVTERTKGGGPARRAAGGAR